jgi:hypothetical protein
MAGKAVSDGVLREILEAFVEAKKLPSPDALSQLAAAANSSVKDVKDKYREVYQDTELSDGDPWSRKKG